MTVRGITGWLLGGLVRVWVWTWRTELVGSAPVTKSKKPSVFAFWHGQQMALLSVRHRFRLAVLVSWSKDGEWQAGTMRSLGLAVVRGSSSRGGSRGLGRIIRMLRGGWSAGFAVDGPHGPRGFAKAGAAQAARLGGAHLVPVSSAASRYWLVKRSWDRFEVPQPFARVCVAFGEPVDEADALRKDWVLAEAIERARQLAGKRVCS